MTTIKNKNQVVVNINIPRGLTRKKTYKKKPRSKVIVNPTSASALRYSADYIVQANKPSYNILLNDIEQLKNDIRYKLEKKEERENYLPTEEDILKNINNMKHTHTHTQKDISDVDDQSIISANVLSKMNQTELKELARRRNIDINGGNRRGRQGHMTNESLRQEVAPYVLREANDFIEQQELIKEERAARKIAKI